MNKNACDFKSSPVEGDTNRGSPSVGDVLTSHKQHSNAKSDTYRI
jgi:hypothetical protein